MFLLALGNPFVSAYLQSDWFGKGVFWSLFMLSGISWTILIHKGWMLFHVRRLSKDLLSQFSEKDPLGLQLKGVRSDIPHPFFEIYKSFKSKALAIINRNYLFSMEPSFTSQDLELLEAEMCVAAGIQMKKLDKHLFILPTVVTLGPFIGLLGTVWGILLSFSHLQTKMGSEGMLAGLSLALAATVIGLVVAIPALIGNNYFKNALRDQKQEMEDFSHQLLSAIELHYAREENAKETSITH